MFRRLWWSLAMSVLWTGIASAQPMTGPMYSTPMYSSTPVYTAPAPAPSFADSLDRMFVWLFDGPSSSPAQAPKQLWMSGDFIGGFTRGNNIPTLVTAAATGTPRNIAGIEGASGTSSLFGGGNYNGDFRPGFRFNGGWWFAGDSYLGLEAGVMFLGGQSTSPSFNSNQFPILARPYFDATSGLQQAILVAYPGASTGSIDIYAHSGNFVSANIDITERVIDAGWFRSAAMVGYRYYRYEELLTVRQTQLVTDPNFIPGTTAVANDSFGARNEFHGLDMGVRNQIIFGRFSIELLGKVAIGDLRRQVSIAGDTVVTVPGAGVTQYPAGVLALSSNSSSQPNANGNNGAFVSHDWKALPEAGFTLQWEVRPNLNVRLGYSFLLLNGIARASDQIDRTINPNLLPPALPVADNLQFPKFGWHRSDMWIQTVNVGAIWTF